MGDVQLGIEMQARAMGLDAVHQMDTAIQHLGPSLDAVGSTAGHAGSAMAGLTRPIEQAGSAARGATTALEQTSGAARGVGSAASGAVAGVHSLVDKLGGLGQIAVGTAMGGLITQLSSGLVGAAGNAIGSVTALGGAVSRLQRETGGSAQEISGLLAVFKRFGVDTDQASTSLGIFSKKLQGVAVDEEGVVEGTKGFSGTMAELGIHIEDASGKIRPMSQVLLEVADKFKAMPDGVEKTATAMAMFGRAGKDMIPVLNQGSAGIQELMATANKLGLVLSGDNVAAIKQYSAAQKDMNQAFGGLAVQIGTAVMPLLARFAQGIAQAAGVINTTVVPVIRDVLGPVFAVAAGALGGLIELVVRGAQAFIGWEPVVTVINGVKDAFGRLGEAAGQLSGNIQGALKFAFSGDLTGAFAVLKTGLYQAARALFGEDIANAIREGAGRVWDVITKVFSADDLISKITPAFTGIKDAIGKALGGDWSGAFASVKSGIAQAATNLFGEDFVKGVEQAVNTAKTTIQTAMSKLGDAFSGKITFADAGTMFGPLGESIGTAADGLRTKIDAAKVILKTAWDTLGDVFKGTKTFADVGTLFGPLGESIGTGADTLRTKIDMAKVVLTTAWNALMDVFSSKRNIADVAGLFGPIGEAALKLATIIQQVAGSIGTALQPVIANLISIWNTLTTSFASSAPLMQSLGALFASVGSALSLVGNMLAYVGAQMLAGLAPLQQFIPTWEQVKSSLLQIGEVIGGTVVVGIGLLLGAVSGLVGFIAGALPGAIQAVTGAVQVVTGVLNLVTGLIRGTIDTIGALLRGDWAGAWDAAVATVNGMFAAMTTIFTGLSDMVMGTINSMIGGVTGAVSGFVDSIVGFFQGLYNTLVGSSIVPDMADAIVGVFASMIGSITGAVQSFVDVLAGIWDAIKTAGTSAWNGIKDVLTGIWDATTGAGEGIWEGFKGALGTTWDTIKTTADSSWSTIKSTLETTWRNAASAGTGIWEGFKGSLSDIWKKIAGDGGTDWKNMSTGVETVWTNTASAGKTTFSTLKTDLDTIWGDVKTAADTIWGEIERVLQTHFDTILRNATTMGTNLKNDLTRSFDEIKRMVDEVNRAIASIPREVTTVHTTVERTVYETVGSPSPPAPPTGGGGGGEESDIRRAVPHFARGGLVADPTLALIGESGPEMVIPLDELQALFPGWYGDTLGPPVAESAGRRHLPGLLDKPGGRHLLGYADKPGGRHLPGTAEKPGGRRLSPGNGGIWTPGPGGGWHEGGPGNTGTWIPGPGGGWHVGGLTPAPVTGGGNGPGPGGPVINVYLNVGGNVMSEYDLVQTVRRGLVEVARSNPNALGGLA